MTFDWHMLYPLHTVILDNSQVFGGVPCKAQLCNFSKWFFSPRFGVVPIWELWQFCYVRIEPPKLDSVLQEFHRPLPPSSEAVHCRSCTAHCPQAVRQGIARVPRPTAPRH